MKFNTCTFQFICACNQYLKKNVKITENLPYDLIKMITRMLEKKILAFNLDVDEASFSYESSKCTVHHTSKCGRCIF